MQIFRTRPSDPISALDSNVSVLGMRYASSNVSSDRCCSSERFRIALQRIIGDFHVTWQFGGMERTQDTASVGLPHVSPRLPLHSRVSRTPCSFFSLSAEHHSDNSLISQFIDNSKDLSSQSSCGHNSRLTSLSLYNSSFLSFYTIYFDISSEGHMRTLAT